MTRVIHIDRLDLHIDASTLISRPGGAIQVDGVGAHAGLYTYHDDKGKPFVELVPAETLFEADSLDSAAGSPVEIRHGPGLVVADDYQARTHGAWVKAWDAGNGNMGVRLRVMSEEGIRFVRDAIASGDPVELSPTYEVDVSAEPGTTEHGRHDGIQTSRRYNAIAMLGPGEARGGPGMRLQLDGPVCAPAGCRIQVGQVRQDAMTKITVKHDGRRANIDRGTLSWLKLLRFDEARAKADQIETGRLTLEIEGEAPEEFILPRGMIDQMFETLGAGIGAAPAAEPPGMEEEAEVMAEAVDADDEGKADGLTRRDVERMIAKSINREVQKTMAKLDASKTARRRADERDEEVQRHARALKIDATDGRHWAQVALDAIVKARPDLEADTRKLAADAKAGDAVAEGKLRERLAIVAAGATERGDGTLVPGQRIVHTRPKTDARPPWELGEPNKKVEAN
jgi:hypothetical protein